jgi:RNA polymerase sigma-70 factor, ECF subfamily
MWATPIMARLALPPLFRWPASIRQSSLAHANRSSPARSCFPVFTEEFNQKLDRFTHGIVRRKVKQLIGRAGFTQQDREDLEQELLLRVLQSLPSFDPKQAHRNKFVTAVVERHVATILRNKRAEKRNDQLVASINVTVEVEGMGAVELAQTVSEDELAARLGRKRRSAEDLANLALDIATVIAAMPKEWQELAERRKTQSMQEISDALGIPRTTLNETMQLITARFKRAGLREYL